MWILWCLLRVEFPCSFRALNSLFTHPPIFTRLVGATQELFPSAKCNWNSSLGKKQGEAGTNGEREKERHVCTHAQAGSQRPYSLKERGKKEKKTNKVRLQWQCAPAELLTCWCAAQSHPSASAAGDLQAQTIWGGLVHLYTGASTVPCTTPAPLPTASHNLETFGAVNYIRIEFFLQ